MLTVGGGLLRAAAALLLAATRPADVAAAAWQALSATATYYAALLYFSAGGAADACPVFSGPGQRRASVHLFCLARTLSLWHEPHYRAHSFAADMRANLCNVAVPGTGVPLSAFCSCRAAYVAFILLVNPLLSLAAAACTAWWGAPAGGEADECGRRPPRRRRPLPSAAEVAAAYRELLLEPRHWFAVWRHNCLVVAMHALATTGTAGGGCGGGSYSWEDKGYFLLQGDRLGLPVSPFMREPSALFVKHKSVEGGMGIHRFSNFARGGDWILQRALGNSDALAAMLPPGAPLSTLRVVTASTAWLLAEQQQQRGGGVRSGSGAAAAAAAAAPSLPVPVLRRSAAGQSTPQLRGLSPEGGRHDEGEWHSQPGGRGGMVTPPLPSSAGIIRRLNADGRQCQFADAVSSLRTCGLADPALRQSSDGGGGGSAGAAAIPGTAEPAAPQQQQQQQGQQQQQQQQQGQRQEPLLQPPSPAKPPQQHDGGGQGPGASCAGASPERSAAAAGRAATPGACSPCPAGRGYGGVCDVVTAVWRAGLAGRTTDHSSVCFRVDVGAGRPAAGGGGVGLADVGRLGAGVSSNHWYRLGLRALGRVDGAGQRVWTHHPDSGARVAGRRLEGMQDVLDTVVQAHMVAMPDVPLVGWDVALTPQGVFLLEANISCNLFHGTFDEEGFYEMLLCFLAALDRRLRGRGGSGSAAAAAANRA